VRAAGGGQQHEVRNVVEREKSIPSLPSRGGREGRQGLGVLCSLDACLRTLAVGVLPLPLCLAGYKLERQQQPRRGVLLADLLVRHATHKGCANTTVNTNPPHCPAVMFALACCVRAGRAVRSFRSTTVAGVQA
jgi:hypothetical protein